MKNTLSISWKLKYMELAKTIASWSKDPSTQVGAICVGEIGQVLSQGYNGFPRGVLDLPEKLEDRTEKYKHTVHAEMNCIYHACRTGVSLKGSSMFVYGLPICHECAKAIIQVGIKKVLLVFGKDDKPDDLNFAIRNVPLADTINQAGLNVYDLSLIHI